MSGISSNTIDGEKLSKYVDCSGVKVHTARVPGMAEGSLPLTWLRESKLTYNISYHGHTTMNILSVCTKVCITAVLHGKAVKY